MSAPIDPNQTAKDLAFGDAVRRQLEHEDVLIVNRLSWLIASQSFLFTAYAIILNGPLQTRVPRFTAKQDLIEHIVPLIALVSCALIYLGVLGGLRVMSSLRATLATHQAAISGEYRPPIQGTRLTLLLGHAAPLVLPPLFAAAWIIVLATR